MDNNSYYVQKGYEYWEDGEWTPNFNASTKYSSKEEAEEVCDLVEGNRVGKMDVDLPDEFKPPLDKIEDNIV